MSRARKRSTLVGLAIVMPVVVLLTGLGVVVATADKRLRLNERPESVHRPARPQDYGVALVGSDLYVAWLGRQEFGLQVYLSRIDLEDFSLKETLQMSQGKGATSKGGRMFPDVVEYQGDVYVSWLDRGQRQKRSWHSVNILSLSERRQDVQPHLFEFGKFMGSPQLVKTDKGLFLLGFSQNLADSDWRIRLYKKTTDDWLAIQQLDQDQYKGRDPYLVGDREGLGLFWVWGNQVFRANSADGEHWSEPKIVVQRDKRIDSLQLTAFDERIQLAWVEQEWDSAEVMGACSEGSSWTKPESLVKLGGKGVTIVLASGKKIGTRAIAYSYNSPDGAGKVIGVASEQGGWAPRPLTEEDSKFTGSLVPSLFEGGDRLYVGWSFYPRATSLPEAESLYVAALDGSNDGEFELKPTAIGLHSLQTVETVPRFWQFRGKLYVSYFSSRVMLGAGILSRGDLYLEQVELLREARGEQAE